MEYVVPSLLVLLVLERILEWSIRLWAKKPEALPVLESSRTNRRGALTQPLATLLRGTENLEPWEERWKAFETKHPMPENKVYPEFPEFD